MKNAQQLADVLARFADAVNDVANEIRDVADNAAYDQGGQEVEAPDYDGPAEAPARDDGPRIAADAMVQVSAGDLWKVINSSRKMIRFARQGKIPSLEQRNPLSRAIKAIKRQGLAKKPYDVNMNY